MKKGLVFIFLLLIGCSATDQIDEKELIAFLLDEDNGLTQVRQDSGFTISIMVRPSDFIARQQLISGTLSEYDSLRKIYDDYMYFIIDITKDGKDLETIYALRQEDFASRISFLSSGFSGSIKLNLSGQSFPVEDYIYSRSYGNGSSSFLIAFKRVDQDMEVAIDGSDLGFGKINFPFRYSKINKTPKLKLKQA